MSGQEYTYQDADVVEVQKSYFFDGMTLPVNVYMKLAAQRFLLIGKKSEKAIFSTLASFKNANSQVFVLKIDYDEFIRSMTSFTEAILAKKEVPNAMKAKYVTGIADTVIEDFASKKFGSEAQLSKVSKMVVTLCHDVSGFDEITKIMADLPNEESKHAMATCMVCLIICEEMEIKQPLVLEKMAKAALLHDIGLRYIPQEFQKRPQHEWTLEERQAYESHPVKTVEALRDLKEITNDVLISIAEHHENALGTGFPKKIRDVKMSPLGRILSCANYFSQLIFERIPGARVYDAIGAVDYMESLVGQPFNKQVFRALKNVVNKDELKRKMQS